MPWWILFIVFLTSVFRLGSAQEYFLHGNRPYIILPSASETPENPSPKFRHLSDDEIIWRSDIPDADEEYVDINVSEYLYNINIINVMNEVTYLGSRFSTSLTETCFVAVGRLSESRLVMRLISGLVLSLTLCQSCNGLNIVIISFGYADYATSSQHAMLLH